MEMGEIPRKEKKEDRGKDGKKAYLLPLLAIEPFVGTLFKRAFLWFLFSSAECSWSRDEQISRCSPSIFPPPQRGDGKKKSEVCVVECCGKEWQETQKNRKEWGAYNVRSD